MLYEITNAVAHTDHTVTITWADGMRGVVDFTPVIERGALGIARESVAAAHAAHRLDQPGAPEIAQHLGEMIDRDAEGRGDLARR